MKGFTTAAQSEEQQVAYRAKCSHYRSKNKIFSTRDNVETNSFSSINGAKSFVRRTGLKVFVI
jgi:hypothetical protein